MPGYELYCGDAIEVLRTLPAGSVQTCVTSPPYYGLRRYMPDSHPDRVMEIGAEFSPEEYVERLVEVFREVRRVLHPTGTIWVNLGDSFQDKQLLGIPWRVAFALQADDWVLRSDIIWCLSGGTYVYARTQKGDMPMTIKDLARLDPATVQLWNGEKWTQLLGMSKSARKGDELELVLRSGERIACTPTHKFPTQRGLLTAGELVAGDTLQRVRLPEPEQTKDGKHISLGAAWLAGLYIAEGSRAGDTIQIAGHANQNKRLAYVQEIAQSYGGSVTYTIDGNNMSIRIYGKVLNAIIDELVSGKTAKDKGFAPVVWRYSDAFISSMMMGYLDGDGGYDEPNNRWRLGFVRNHNLERDLRTACARLGWHLVLNMSQSSFDGRLFPSFRGEIRIERSGHHNERNTGEIAEIRKARSRNVYDLGVADEPHVFALASGILTHNSKPNPMPESVQDRPTKAHEYIFLLSKSKKYFYDHEAIREEASEASLARINQANFANQKGGPKDYRNGINPNRSMRNTLENFAKNPGRNKRSVWHVPTRAYKGAHYATFPPDLIEPCILAGSSPKCCAKCGAPWERVVERRDQGWDGSKYGERAVSASGGAITGGTDKSTLGSSNGKLTGQYETLGWQATCTCGAGVAASVVLDPFYGSGTTGSVAIKHGRNFIGIDLDERNLPLAHDRIGKTQPLLLEGL